MISVNEAKSVIQASIIKPAPAKLSLSEAAGLVLAADVIAKYDIPAYNQSSMDGYAIAYADRNAPIRIVSEAAAGADRQTSLSSGECARIFTGAPLPEGSDTVVMQEKTSVADGVLAIDDPSLKLGSNVRPRGSEVKAGDLALSAGNVLNAPTLGFLASIGESNVTVFPSPRVTIILTGNELQKQEGPLGFGKVYEANSIMLTTALKDAGVNNIFIKEAKDNIDQLKNVLEQSLQESEFVLLTGGVSVGDYDFVTAAASLCSITTKFHKVKQKPGKPLYFGTKENRIIFGLPGNPSSALTCFYIYVLPAIERYLQRPFTERALKVKLKNGFTKIPGLTQFMKAWYEDGSVNLLHAQESFRLHSFARANCLAELDESIQHYSPGEEVIIHPIPQAK